MNKDTSQLWCATRFSSRTLLFYDGYNKLTTGVTPVQIPEQDIGLHLIKVTSGMSKWFFKQANFKEFGKSKGYTLILCNQMVRALVSHSYTGNRISEPLFLVMLKALLTFFKWPNRPCLLLLLWQCFLILTVHIISLCHGCHVLLMWALPKLPTLLLWND